MIAQGERSPNRREWKSAFNSRLPFGVYLTTTLNFGSGDAYSITTGRDDNGDGVTNDRPAGERRNGHYGPGYRTVGLSLQILRLRERCERVLDQEPESFRQYGQRVQHDESVGPRQRSFIECVRKIAQRGRSPRNRSECPIPVLRGAEVARLGNAASQITRLLNS